MPEPKSQVVKPSTSEGNSAARDQQGIDSEVKGQANIVSTKRDTEKPGTSTDTDEPIWGRDDVDGGTTKKSEMGKWTKLPSESEQRDSDQHDQALYAVSTATCRPESALSTQYSTAALATPEQGSRPASADSELASDIHGLYMSDSTQLSFGSLGSQDDSHDSYA